MTGTTHEQLLEERITVNLSTRQAIQLAEFAAYGIDEKEYDIDENDPYTDEETLAVRAEIKLAKDAIAEVNAKLEPYYVAARAIVARQREQDEVNHARADAGQQRLVKSRQTS